MPSLSSQSQALLTSFGQQRGVTADQVRNLEGVINSSPALIDQVNAAVASGHLTKFRLLPAGTHAGGTYDGQNKAINLPASALTMTGPRAQTQANDLTFVLGHEIQHSFNHAAIQQAYSTFSSEVEAAALTTHDYTGPIGKLIASNRRDEASAEIAGWNALAGRIMATNPSASLGDMHAASWRAADFVSRTPGPPASFAAYPNLAINADLTIAPTAANVEAMGQNYFDKSPSSTGLGHHGNSDYANYYGAYAVGVASQAEQRHLVPGAAPQMTLKTCPSCDSAKSSWKRTASIWGLATLLHRDIWTAVPIHRHNTGSTTRPTPTHTSPFRHRNLNGAEALMPPRSPLKRQTNPVIHGIACINSAVRASMPWTSSSGGSQITVVRA